MTKEFNPADVMWVEKYRPKDVRRMVGDFKDKILKQLENPNAMQHLLLYSKAPGTGKTTLAKAIINELGADALVINSSDDRKIETIREKVREFANTKSSKDGLRRIIFLDEADGMLKASQEALRNIMETYAVNALFILTCNSIEKIHPAIKSRCLEIAFAYPEREEIFTYLQWICEEEKLSFTEEGLKALVEKNYPSIRNSVQVLQELHTEGKDVTVDNVKIYNPIMEELWLAISENKDYKKVKEEIFSSTVDARELNLYFWNRSWETNNIRMIQLTCQNEKAIAYGSDAKVVVSTSLIDMVSK